MTVSSMAPRFGSTDIAPLMNLTSHAAEAYRNKTQDEKLRRQILEDLQNERPDLFTANSPLTQTVLNKKPVYQPPVMAKPPIRFGMLGQSVI